MNLSGFILPPFNDEGVNLETAISLHAVVTHGWISESMTPVSLLCDAITENGSPCAEGFSDRVELFCCSLSETN